MKSPWQLFKDIFRPFFYWFYFRYYRILEIARPSRINDPKKIPIIINNFNRLTYLRKLITALEERGYHNIHIIDNASSYPPLLEYYETCPYTVFRLKKNLGHLALWDSGISRKFDNDFFAYTDSDVVPVKECPDDFMKVFLDTLKKYRFARKTGFSLLINDLPEHYRNKAEVLRWESQYYEREVDELLYRAPIDTTFALYRPRARGGSNAYVPMFRTKFPYAAVHLPWYADSSNLSEEDEYYVRHASTFTMWTNLDKK